MRYRGGSLRTPLLAAALISLVLVAAGIGAPAQAKSKSVFRGTITVTETRHFQGYDHSTTKIRWHVDGRAKGPVGARIVRARPEIIAKERVMGMMVYNPVTGLDRWVPDCYQERFDRWNEKPWGDVIIDVRNADRRKGRTRGYVFFVQGGAYGWTKGVYCYGGENSYLAPLINDPDGYLPNPSALIGVGSMDHGFPSSYLAPQRVKFRLNRNGSWVTEGRKHRTETEDGSSRSVVVKWSLKSRHPAG